MAEFASNAKANTGLALSGTSLGFSLLGGGLSWLLGGNRMMNGGCCNEDHLINRYELQKEQRITTLETENALLKSNIYTDQKSIELYRYVDGKFNRQGKSEGYKSDYKKAYVQLKADSKSIEFFDSLS